MIVSYCNTESGEKTITPTYPSGSETFDLISGFDWASIQVDGDVIVDITGLSVGTYKIQVDYGSGLIEIIINIEDCEPEILESTFSYCINSGEFTQQLYADNVTGNWSLTSPQSGFDLSTSGLLNINTSSTGVGTFTLDIEVGGDPLEIQVQVLACTTPSSLLTTDCKLDSIGIVWVNQEGGRQSYWFNQPKEFDVTQSGGQIWINSSQEKRYLGRGRIEYGVLITQEFIPIEHITSITSLKNSIQAWACSDMEDAGTYESIIIDEDSFVIRRTTDRFYRISFEFKYSIAKTIQRQ